MILEEAGDDEAGGDLAADLVIQRVPELDGDVGVSPALPLRLGHRAQIGVGDLVADDERVLPG